MNDYVELLPDWRNFFEGVVDPEDGPLNISHTTPRQDDHKKFWEQSVKG